MPTVALAGSPGLRRQVDARPLAATRVLVGVAGTVVALESWSVVLGLASPGVVRVPWVPSPALAFPPWTADALLILTLVAFSMLTLGLLTRAAAVTACISSATSLALDQQVFSNHLTLVVLLTGYLALGRPGGAWSLDSRIGGTRTTPLWVNLLVLSQVSAVYLFAGLSKVNAQYLAGAALDRWLSDGLGVPSAWLAPLAALSVVTEVALALLLWLPRTRVLAAAVGVLLHVSVVVALSSPVVLTAFGLLTISAYPLFLTRPSLRQPGRRPTPART